MLLPEQAGHGLIILIIIIIIINNKNNVFFISVTLTSPYFILGTTREFPKAHVPMFLCRSVFLLRVTPYTLFPCVLHME